MVKGASEIVDHVSGDKYDFDGGILDVEYAINVISRLRITLTPDSIGFAIDELASHDF